MYLKHDGKVLLKSIRLSRQNLLIMKMLSFLMIVGYLQLSAKGVSQTITLSFSNAPLDKVFKEIRVQSGYTFLFKKDIIKKSALVSCQLNDTPIQDALKIVLENHDLAFFIEKD